MQDSTLPKRSDRPIVRRQFDRWCSYYHYEELPGVSVDKSSITTLYNDGVDKEAFYELDADVHVFDPNFLMNRFKGWEQADIDELRENVAPYFDNTIFTHEYPWHSYCITRSMKRSGNSRKPFSARTAIDSSSRFTIE